MKTCEITVQQNLIKKMNSFFLTRKKPNNLKNFRTLYFSNKKLQIWN